MNTEIIEQFFTQVICPREFIEVMTNYMLEVARITYASEDHDAIDFDALEFGQVELLELCRRLKTDSE